MGKVDLVAVAGLDVILDTQDGLLVRIHAEVRRHGALELEGGGGVTCCMTEQGDQTLPLAIGQHRVKHQLAGVRQVIADQCPGIQPQARIRQVQVVHGQACNLFQVPAEVIAQVTDQTAGKGQFNPSRQGRLTQLRQVLAQALQEIAAAFIRPNRQGRFGPGAEQVITPPLGSRAAAVEQHRARRMANSRKVLGGVGPVG